MANDVFISYSRHDTAVVDEFVSMLEGEGFSVWIDRDGIESGDAFKRVILRAIKESQVVLFFSSEHSNQSDWTAKEIGVAVKYEKHIIPIKIDNSNFNDDVEFDLINLDFVDYTDASKRSGMKEQLLKTLRNKLGKGKTEGKAMEEVGRLSPACPEGAINGIFSVSPTEKVYFSKGNLQYHIPSKTWSFASQQYEVIGEGNGKFKEKKVSLFKKQRVIVDRRDTIDLFGWGTGDNPTNYSENVEEYGSFIDWGGNRIANGGDGWRTLTREEWEYVFEKRTTKSGIRYVWACVNNVNGLILLPDDWDCNCYNLRNEMRCDANMIEASVWNTLQKYGAVFLPDAGCRYGTIFNAWNSLYWSASRCNSDDYRGDAFFVGNDYGSIGRWFGLSVRLVCPAE